MYFKYPELLYALFLLVIPVLVHLFQLRRFRKTEFTNVKFLKKAVLQTRKSSRLKKFLILCTRMLALACIILAFAQPYFPPASGEVQEVETVIYLDNSYSMQARGKNGILLRRSIQDLVENLPADENISLFTNEEEFRNLSAPALRERLQDLDYSPNALPWNVIELKAEDLFNTSNRQKNFIAISDFQHLTDTVGSVDEDINTYLVQLQPETDVNISVDTAYISSRNLDEITLAVEISATGQLQEDVAIGVYDGEQLLTRKTIELNENQEAGTSFSFSSGALPFGRIEISDRGMQFDNQIYFSINENPPVKVVVIGDQETGFLERIYRAPEFSLEIFSENNIDFNQISQANLIILNELNEIPFTLVNTLEQLLKEQVFLVVIPSPTAAVNQYNLMFQNLDLPVYNPKIEGERLITDIVFEHPLYSSVFDEQVTNFEYPKVQTSYPVTGASYNILEYQNGHPFLYGRQNIFVFTAPLRSSNSNFKNAPLVVPTFYNIGNLAISSPNLYSTLGNPEIISIQADLQKDEILKLSSPEITYIPQQQSFRNKVELIIEDLPQKAGHYRVLRDTVSLRSLSFNIDRRENQPVDPGLNTGEGVAVFSSIPDVFSGINSANEVDLLWKWFVIFALFFLLTEMLILKFLK